MDLQIVKRSDTAKGFMILPKRWIVERTFGWLGRCRRLAKDFENLTRTQLAFLKLAMIRLMARRIARLLGNLIKPPDRLLAEERLRLLARHHADLRSFPPRLGLRLGLVENARIAEAPARIGNRLAIRGSNLDTASPAKRDSRPSARER